MSSTSSTTTTNTTTTTTTMSKESTGCATAAQIQLQQLMKSKVISTCKHLEDYKREGGCSRFKIIENYILTARSRLVDSDKLATPHCMKCNCFNGRLHVCLQCVFIGCWKASHLQQHFKETGHFLAVDSNLSQVFCSLCDDYVYDSELDEIINSCKLDNTVTLQEMVDPSPKRVKYHCWRPSDQESQIILDNNHNVNNNSSASSSSSKPEDLHNTISLNKNSVVGLRGLNNLGNTCFMNAILQSFIHNPLLRNYFLSDMHKCNKKSQLNGGHSAGSSEDKDSPNESDSSSSNSSLTPSNASGGSSANSNGNGKGNNVNICFGCEMDELYTHIFSGNKAPFTPHHFLYNCWNYSSYFSGYEQQDAHEFLISSLNGIHLHCGGTPDKYCNCIVHCTFGGVLKSELSCLSCNFTSSTSDPFIDISLDIPKQSSLKYQQQAQAQHLQAQAQASQTMDVDEDDANSSKSNTTNSSGNGSVLYHNHHYVNNGFNNNLISCLDRFTQPEKLEEKYFCTSCNSKQESTKQLSFDTLPVVICFHLKRFEQSKSNRRTHKIDTFIEFPSIIDMEPYTTNSQKKKKNERKRKIEEPNQSTSPKNESYIYELYAVVNHIGKIDSGHYTCFVRHNDQWYKCDDSMISSTTIHHVMKSKGYLLFYLKKQLEYSKIENKADK